jgi:hypothetical protein
MLRARPHFLLALACDSLSLFTGQRERDKERGREEERKRERERVRKRERESDGCLGTF